MSLNKLCHWNTLTQLRSNGGLNRKTRKQKIQIIFCFSFSKLATIPPLPLFLWQPHTPPQSLSICSSCWSSFPWQHQSRSWRLAASSCCSSANPAKKNIVQCFRLFTNTSRMRITLSGSVLADSSITTLSKSALACRSSRPFCFNSSKAAIFTSLSLSIRSSFCWMSNKSSSCLRQ